MLAVLVPHIRDFGLNPCPEPFSWPPPGAAKDGPYTTNSLLYGSIREDVEGYLAWQVEESWPGLWEQPPGPIQGQT